MNINAHCLALAKKIIARSDIVVENFAGGVMKRMGLGYEELKKVKPDIIMLSACMQGQTGPHANHPGLGHHLAALVGFCMQVLTRPGAIRPPITLHRLYRSPL